MQKKATNHYISVVFDPFRPVVLFIVLYECFPNLCVFQEATEQFFPVVLFIMLYKVVLTFESVDEIPKCNHSNESY